MPSPEPWLRGPIDGVHPLLQPVLFSFAQAREDLAAHTEGLTVEEMWTRPGGAAPTGFHIRHIAGSVERLTTYLKGQQLAEAQVAALKAEMEPGASREELLAQVDSALSAAEAYVRTVDPARLAEPRTVGRKALPTTAGGLLVHIAEHTQRHVGQAITTARIVRGLRGW